MPRRDISARGYRYLTDFHQNLIQRLLYGPNEDETSSRKQETYA
jgi:hypothetical protein